MREIVLDTETTGIKPEEGHKIVEIGCLELVNHVATGRTWREYINPERDMPEDALSVHGIDSKFLSDKPRFAEIADSFLEFIDGAKLVIHNAPFDMGFLNAELRDVSLSPLPNDLAVDTLAMARKRYPGANNSLDGLCKRFGIDNARRVYHGALLDCELLAEVYLELIGGREPGLALAAEKRAGSVESAEPAARKTRPPRAHAPSAAEEDAHRAMIARLNDALWNAR